MKVLVTGAHGFVGKHMVQELLRNKHQVLSLVHEADKGNGHHACDLTNRRQVFEVLQSLQPEAVVHLAGMAHVVQAARDVSGLIDINVIAVQHLCDGINAYAQQSVPFLLASSALVYGSPHGVQPVNEGSPVSPDTAYSRSKLAAEMVLSCYEGTQVRPYIARPFNHTGPGQAPSFVCPGFVKKVKEADAGSIPVGNLSACRDMSDVRDIVRAYGLILERLPKERCFVLGSGALIRISEILDIVIRHSGKKIEPKVDPSLLRPVDDGAIYADYGLAERVLGWRPQYGLEQTLQDLYNA